MARPRLGLTTRGSALLTAGLTAAVCGVALGQRDLVRVAVLLVVAPVAAAIFVGRSRFSIHCARFVDPARVPGGERVSVRLDLTNQSILPIGSLMLEDELGRAFSRRARFTLDSLRGRETRSLAYQLPAADRGRYVVGPLSMRLVDPFGLVERTRAFRATSQFVVLPVVDPLPEGTLPMAWDSTDQSGSSSVGAHGSDDASTREYRHGDDLRKVHWRSTARIGALMVRQEERPWHGRTTVLLDTRAVAHRHRLSQNDDDDRVDGSDPRQRSSLEWAISAAASASAFVAERGRALDLLIDAEPLRFDGAGALLDHLAAIRASDAGDLARPAAALGVAGAESTVVAVLGRLDELSLHALAAVRPASGAGRAILLDTASWTARSPEAHRRDDAALEAALTTLTAAGWHVVVARCGDPVGAVWSALLAPSSVPLAAAGPA